MNDKQEALLDLYPQVQFLSAAQLAKSHAFAPGHVLAMCQSLTMPISVHIVQRQPAVRQVDFLKYLGCDEGELASLPPPTFKPLAKCKQSPNLLRNELVEQWFLSELRSTLFQASAMEALASLSIAASKQDASPQLEHCKQLLEFERGVRNAEIANERARLGAVMKTLQMRQTEGEHSSLDVAERHQI